MTFRSENLTKDPPTVLMHSDLQEGQKVEGRVKKIEDYGLFLEIKDSKLTGLCHKSEVCLLFTSRKMIVNVPSLLAF